jgi:hypothetical protein
MQAQDPTSWKHSNRYNATAGCEYCQGVLQHEPWCDSQNPRVRYVHELMVGTSRLSQADHLYLHGLGVVWKEETVSVG